MYCLKNNPKKTHQRANFDSADDLCTAKSPLARRSAICAPNKQIELNLNMRRDFVEQQIRSVARRIFAAARQTSSLCRVQGLLLGLDRS